jgi:hypothetical protein
MPARNRRLLAELSGVRPVADSTYGRPTGKAGSPGIRGGPAQGPPPSGTPHWSCSLRAEEI